MRLRCLLPLLLAWVLTGCGYKGALQLPDRPPAQAERSAPGPSDAR
ncbi:MAG: lipoprotein [Magnetococcus sp. MYC-9]